MTREDAIAMRKKTGTTFLDEPNINYDIIDVYRDDVDVAWIMCAKYFWNLQRSPSSKVEDQTLIRNNDKFYWISCDVVISRLWYHGIRSRSTVSRAFTALCKPSNGLPPVLLQYKSYNRNGHPMVYYAETNVFKALFSTDGGTIEQQATVLNKCLKDNTPVDNVCDPDEVPDPEGELPKLPEKPAEPFTFPDWWDHFWEEVSATGKYTDKIYKDKYPTVVNGYVQDTIEAISSILDGTYYDKGSYGEEHDVKYDLSAVTIDSIIDALEKYNVKEPITMKEVVCPFPGKGKKSRKSRFLSLVCVGTEWPKDNASVKLSKVPRIKPDKCRPELKDPTPSFVWAEGYSSVQNTPDRHYSEFAFDSPMFWGLYREIQEYHDECTKPDGIWIHNNTSGKPPVSMLKIVMAMLEAAKDAGVSYDELIREVKVGVDKNWIWALTIQKVFLAQNSYKIGRGLTGDPYKFLYDKWPLKKEFYKE